MSRIVLSGSEPLFVQALQKMGFQTVLTDTVRCFPHPEQQHADMQILPMQDAVFVLQEAEQLRRALSDLPVRICENRAGEAYPSNVLLNFLYHDGALYGNSRYIEPGLKRYCQERHIPIVHVNQGYARCSVLPIASNAVITADVGMEKALQAQGTEVLRIRTGYVRLTGYDYGFIGGAAGVLIQQQTLVFFGNVKAHPDYGLIERFCDKYQMHIELLCPQLPLTDIGGMVLLP